MKYIYTFREFKISMTENSRIYLVIVVVIVIVVAFVVVVQLVKILQYMNKIIKHLESFYYHLFLFLGRFFFRFKKNFIADLSYCKFLFSSLASGHALIDVILGQNASKEAVKTIYH